MNVAMLEAARASGARVVGGERLPHDARVSTDTRTLQPGDVYVALRGETFDGHAFARDAVAAGASAVVVDDDAAIPAGTPALVVGDTTHAYLAFASVARRGLRAKVVAITGSAGKTTTKQFVAAILERTAPGRVVATHANENNEIGVAKLLLGAAADAAYVVVEFGARHYGEIEPLARVALPDVAVLTNVGDAHLEIFGSRERLVETKWGIFATGARPVLPAVAFERGVAGPDAERADRARALADARAGRPRTLFYAADSDDTRVPFAPDADANETCVVLTGRSRLRMIGNDRIVENASYATHVGIAGTHNLRNVAAASAAAYRLGIAPAEIAAALGDLDLPAGRYERIALGDTTLIYDGYNASMQGTLATLASFAAEPARRRIAVLGSMAELGDDAAAMHERVGEAAARSGCAFVLVGGDYAADLARGARAGGADASAIVPFASNDDAVAWLLQHREAGDAVLLKASRRYRLEEVVAGLRDARANDGSTHA